MWKDWTTTLIWQNDVYNVNNVTPTTEPGTVLSGWTGRSLPQARLDWKYPFVREMGRFRQVIAESGQMKIAPMMQLGITFDHRLIDGVHAAKMAKLLEAIFAEPEKHLG